jgi:hypothetical protein
LGAALAPAAHATDITNPAENPAPINVTIDGQTYRDGADTLPGYDDYACTPIPNVQYDFSNDQIQYYDGQGNLITTAHWTEWDRISSYQTWVDQQHAGTPSNTNNNAAPSSADATPTATTPTSAGAASPAPAATGPAATSPTATSNAATSPAVKSKGSTTKTKSSTTKATNSPAKTTTSATKTTSAAKQKTKRSAATSSSSHGTTTSKTATKSHAKKHGTSTASSTKHAAATSQAAATDATGTDAPAGGTGTAPSAAPSAAAPAAAPSAADAPKYKLVSDTGVGGVGDTRPVGVGILVAVFAAAGLAFLIGSARRRRTFGRRDGTGPYA